MILTGRLSIFRHEAVATAFFTPTEGAFVFANQQTQRLPTIPVVTSVATLCGLWCITGPAVEGKAPESPCQIWG